MDIGGTSPASRTPYSDIRKGVTALLQANAVLYGSNGAKQNRPIGDSMIEPEPGCFYGLVKSLGYEPDTMARIMADGALAKTLLHNSPLYLEGLQSEAERVSREKKTTYVEFQEADRLKLAGFLYRPANERPLTYEEWWSILFPATMGEMKKAKPGDVKAVNERGLRKMLRCMLEYNSLDFPPYESIAKLWKERDWKEYIEHAKPVHMSFKDSDFSVSVSLASPEIDNPPRIENLLIDVINYVRRYEADEDTFNLDKILYCAMKVLPMRKRMLDSDYFSDETREADRLVMIQKVIEDVPLL